MSVTAQSETRNYTRQLTLTRDMILPGIKDNAYDNSPLLSAFFGRLTNAQFGPVKLNGRAKRVQDGGESIRVNHRLGKNATAKTLTGGWDTVDTTPQDNVRFSRANWVHYSATATINETEKLVNTGSSAISSIVEEETTSAVLGVVDLAADHIYSNGSDATRLTSLQQIISANDSVQGLSGATYSRWNSRGKSARGTAAASISFGSGSFATQGIDDMRRAWLNAQEGAIHPHGIYTTHLIYGYYEGSLQPQQRFTSNDMANAGFMQLAFNVAPVFADSKCTSGEMHFLNFDALYIKVLAGADVTATPFVEALDQEAYTSKVMLKAQLICENRLFVNKLTGITS
jgi:hypothetical protein